MNRNATIWDLFSLKGQLGLVAGGAVHLGYDMAQALSEAGADLIITSRSKDRAVKAAEALSQQAGTSVIGRSLDATDEDQVARFFQEVSEEFGHLEVLVNNVGGAVYTGGGFGFVDRRSDDYRNTLRLNLDSMFFSCREAMKIMRSRGKGSIINIASMSGIVGRDHSVYPDTMRPNMHDYSLAKGGVIAFTRALAAEAGRCGIRVNAISPGGFARPEHDPEFVRRYSKQTMLGRMGTDGLDLKGAVVFLASDASSYVTGHNLVVDGGFTAW